MNAKADKVVFLDRDGVINQDSEHYIKSWAEFKFLPGSLKALRALYENDFTTILITNQSAINRRIITVDTLEDIHSRMKSAIESAGGRIKDIFYCPHAPADACDCRKPKAGLILKAIQRYNIDLVSACMVGDNAKDIECARNAGCDKTLLVKTGNGLSAREALARRHIFPDYVAADLLDAAKWIIARL